MLQFAFTPPPPKVLLLSFCKINLKASAQDGNPAKGTLVLPVAGYNQNN